jgi:hypothetical protein
MKKIIQALLYTTLALAPFFTAPAFGAMSPLSFNLVPPVQFPPEDFSVTGLRLSLGYGHHRDMYGIDVGVLGNITDQDFAGVALAGIFNSTSGVSRIIGMQAAGLLNMNSGKTSVLGLQLALGANYNTAESAVYGVQLAAANLSDHTTVNGLQLGVYNRARAVRGFQIGIVNVTTNLTGLQIGVINFHHQGVFSVCPILNFGF